MRPGLRTGAIAAAFVAVLVLAVIGWARKPAPAAYNVPVAAYNASAPAYNSPAPVYNDGGGSAWDSNNGVRTASDNGVASAPAVYNDQQSDPYNEGVAVNQCAQPADAQYGYYAPSYETRSGVRTARVRVVEEQPRVVYEDRRVVRRGRSTGKSVAIVAGSAGVGAAIGAIAGGGKGAAIGAIAGGSGGFVYDRLTHNK